MESPSQPRSSRSRCISPASRASNHTRLPSPSSTIKSTSSWWPSGHCAVIINSAFGFIFPSVTSGLIRIKATQNMNAKPNSALNRISVNAFWSSVGANNLSPVMQLPQSTAFAWHRPEIETESAAQYWQSDRRGWCKAPPPYRLTWRPAPIAGWRHQSWSNCRWARA